MAEKPNVTRIKANDDAPAAPSKAKKVKAVRAPKEGKGVLRRIGAYFKGAWVELRQVRWPNRRATWSLTLAVIAFSLAFTVLILTLDALFKYVFQLIIG